jgi:hypothetical protein
VQLLNTLNKLQTDFVSGLFLATENPNSLSIIVNRVSAADRLAIYRNNSFTNLRGALQAVYPVIFKLVGEAFFNHAADEFIRVTPSVSGDLHDYGGSFGDFLANYQPAKALVYLPDTARLEWACHRVFHAADHGGLDVKKLGAIPPEQYGELHFSLHPAAALLASNYPTLQIWQVNQDDYSGDQSVSLDDGGNHLLVSREENFTTRVEALASGDYRFLSALMQNDNLETAANHAWVANGSFDLGVSLQRFVAQKILVDFK